MIVLDWIVAALVGGFVTAAAVEAQLYRDRKDRDRKRSGALVPSNRPPSARGLWSVAEAAWIGARGAASAGPGAGPARVRRPEPDRPGFAAAGTYDVRIRWAPDPGRSGPRRRR